MFSNKESNINLIKIDNKKIWLKVYKGILTKVERNMFNYNIYQRRVIIGIIFSDSWVQKRDKWNPRISFKQAIGNFEYFWYIFTQLSNLCSGYPWLCKTTKKGKIFFSLRI